MFTVPVGFIDSTTPVGVTTNDIPNAAMTSNSAPSPWVASASTTLAGGYEPYKAFDDNKTNTYTGGWHADAGGYTTGGAASTAYQTSLAGGGTVDGQWVQLQNSTTPRYINTIKLYVSKAMADALPARVTTRIVLLGSNTGTGSTWYKVYDSYAVLGRDINWTDDATAPFSEDMTFVNTTTYNYHRLVITQLGGNEYVVLLEVEYTGS